MTGHERPRSVIGTAYGRWDSAGTQRVYAILAARDGQVCVVLAGERVRGQDFKIEKGGWTAFGTWRSTSDFESIFLPPAPTEPLRTAHPWPRRQPRVELPDPQD